MEYRITRWVLFVELFMLPLLLILPLKAAGIMAWAMIMAYIGAQVIDKSNA